MPSETTTPALLHQPDWPLPPGAGAAYSDRRGGVSEGPYASLNLGVNSGDAPDAVAENRRRVTAALPAAPLWLRQVHGTDLVYAPSAGPDPEADASWTDQPGQVLAIQTADCLPVLLADGRGCWVAAIHAGWRGLAAGIIGLTLSRLPGPVQETHAWLGPAIGARHYPVGADVYQAFIDAGENGDSAFTALGNRRYQLDLHAMARQQLNRLGITSISAEPLCTYALPQRFYSYRRDGCCGRQAAFIWLQEKNK
ncbi:MAG: purine nucleoside phosphorylase YfiH [Wenzhouxiangellaceae bacterium]